jgi:Secretion system C-terminal sorting domain/Cleaved Adhesin Domain
MKKMLSLLLFCTATMLVVAQSAADTLLFENFQDNKFPQWGTAPVGNDVNWVYYDQDGLQPFDKLPEHRSWYHSIAFYDPNTAGSIETNYCAASFSWMAGFAPGNRNWLITPPLHVSDNNLVLHWKSASHQLPHYMDGYLVLVATDSNLPQAFTDTLFQAASMTGFTGSTISANVADFTFTPGVLHQNGAYTAPWDVDDATVLRGLLEPHSVSLSAYAGKTIYLAFLHNSDDDYMLALDDVLVTNAAATTATGAAAADAFRFVTYPNPAAHQLNVMYRLAQPALVNMRVTDTQGKVVLQSNRLQQQAGEQQTSLPIAALPAGSYHLSLQIGDQVLTKAFVKA